MTFHFASINISQRHLLIIIIQEYIKSLIEVMHTAEDLESLENLHALCSLMQTLRASKFRISMTAAIKPLWVQLC